MVRVGARVGFIQSLILYELTSGQTTLDSHTRSQLCDQGELPPVLRNEDEPGLKQGFQGTVDCMQDNGERVVQLDTDPRPYLHSDFSEYWTS